MNKQHEFSKIVNTYWQEQSGTKIAFKNASFEVFINENLDEDYEVMLLEFSEDKNWVIMRLALLERLGKKEIQKLDFVQLKSVLEKEGIILHGADYVFYFSEEEKTRIRHLELPENIRVLTKEDAVYFAEFESRATEQDLDDASVDLAHWKVYGVFEAGKLVAVASMYPWDEESKIGDVGVLTLPNYRGKGYAKKLIEICSKAALLQGYEPQYRCQLDNLASVRLAKKLTLDLFALWNVSIKL
ncbi:GNAT family N-acetyltransferase [Myroides odoratus]|uniref:GNAT family N-acetyltransferase n=1 Tax=Myroides odoratus TaxID=256 RepID=UPI0039B0F293